MDGSQMFARPGPRLVDALEFLVGLLHDKPDLIPKDFPWQYWPSGKSTGNMSPTGQTVNTSVGDCEPSGVLNGKSAHVSEPSVPLDGTDAGRAALSNGTNGRMPNGVTNSDEVTFQGKC